MYQVDALPQAQQLFTLVELLDRHTVDCQDLVALPKEVNKTFPLRVFGIRVDPTTIPSHPPVVPLNLGPPVVVLVSILVLRKLLKVCLAVQQVVALLVHLKLIPWACLEDNYGHTC